MSNPSLELSIASDVTIADVERLLGVDLSGADMDAPVGELRPGKIGWIRVYTSRSLLPVYGPYAKPFRWRLHLDTAYRWKEVRLSLAISLCDWLLEDFGGHYFAYLDTDEPLFYCNQVELVCNKNIEAFCRSAKAFGRREWQVADLPGF